MKTVTLSAKQIDAIPPSRFLVSTALDGDDLLSMTGEEVVAAWREDNDGDAPFSQVLDEWIGLVAVKVDNCL